MKSAAVISQFDFDADQRHRFWSASLRDAGFDVVEIELKRLPSSPRVVSEISKVGQRLSVYHWPDAHLMKLPSKDNRERTPIGRYLERLLTSSTLALREVGNLFERFDVVVANDLIPAAAVQHSRIEAGVKIYDAQEFFVESYDVLGIRGMSEWEKQLWFSREAMVAREFEKLVCISMEGSKLLSDRYEVNFGTIPNYLPTSQFSTAKNFASSSNTQLNNERPVRFVFVGRAEPNRGLETLLQAWNLPKSVATLDLYIPDSPHKRKLVRDYVRATKSDAVSFPDPLGAGEIVEVLATYDVGIVPYSYPPPYTFASPTKFGEYLAAGLPVLVSERCESVARLIREEGLGYSASFDSVENVTQMIRNMANLSLLHNLRQQVRSVRNQFSWDSHFSREITIWLESSIGARFPVQRAHHQVGASKQAKDNGFTNTTKSHRPAVAVQNVVAYLTYWISTRSVRATRALSYLRIPRRKGR